MAAMPRVDFFWWGDALRKAGIVEHLKETAESGAVEVTVGLDALVVARKALTHSGWRIVSIRAHDEDEGFSVVAERRRDDEHH